MERRVLRGGRPSLYRTLSVLSGVGGSVDRAAGLCMIGRCVMVCSAVAASPITGRVSAECSGSRSESPTTLEVQDVGTRVSDVAGPLI